MVYWQRQSVNLWCIGILHIHRNMYATEMCSLFFYCCCFFPTQSVFAYTYPPTTPASVQESCTPEKISLLHAVNCLFYRYDQQEWIKYIWAIGLLAAGQSSTMTVSWWIITFVVWQFSNHFWTMTDRYIRMCSIGLQKENKLMNGEAREHIGNYK